MLPTTLLNCIAKDITRQSIVTDYQHVIELLFHISVLNYALSTVFQGQLPLLFLLLLLLWLIGQVLIALVRLWLPIYCQPPHQLLRLEYACTL